MFLGTDDSYAPTGKAADELEQLRMDTGSDEDADVILITGLESPVSGLRSRVSRIDPVDPGP
jgi:hypothetical protein